MRRASTGKAPALNPDPDVMRLRACGESLCAILERLGELNERLFECLAAREEAFVAIEVETLRQVRDEEEALLHRVVDEEKQRLLLTEEIGDLLGHPAPSEIRVREMLSHLPPELSGRLSGSRDRLRQSARRLGRRNAEEPGLIEHTLGHIQVFLSHLVHEEMLGQAPVDDGSALIENEVDEESVRPRDRRAG